MALPITNTEAVQRSKAKQYLGSFWNTNFSESSQILALSNMPRQTPLIGDFKSVFYDLAGQHSAARRKTFYTVTFKQNQIIRTGTQVFDDQYVETNFGTNYNDAAFSFNFYRLPYGALHMSRVTPAVIQANGRTLALGVDFFLDGDFIFFRQDPSALFPGGFYTIISGVDTGYRPIMADFLGIDCPAYQDLIIQYVKKYQTPAWFKLACAAAAGMIILRHTDKLLDIQTSFYDTVYIFDRETVRVPYAHTPLIVGTTYPKYYVIGDGLRIVYGDPRTRWWRQIDWHGGLSLDPLIPTFKGLQVLDQDTYAFVAGSDAGSQGGNQAHTRLDWKNADWALEESYWSQVGARETNMGYYLNGVIGLGDAVDSGNPKIIDTFAKLIIATDAANAFNVEMGWPLEKPDYAILPDKLLVNGLDMLFEAVLGDVAMVISIDPTRIGDPKGLYAFLRTEMTPGAAPVIVSFPPPVLAETLDNSSGNAMQDAALFYPAAYLLVTEAPVDSTIVADSAVFRTETAWSNIN